MAADDNSGGRPAGPVVLRIKLRYDDLDAMVQRFAPNVGKAGLFLPTRAIQPVGTEVKFELRLANDKPVLVGLGRVKRVKAPDPANPRAAFGMAIELMRVSREGREVIIRMIERRRAMGLVDVAIPMPEDAESARRNEVETQPRSETSGVVRDAMAQAPSAGPADALLATQPASGPIAVAKPTNASAVTTAASEPARSSSPLLTSPRAGSGPMAVARDQASGRIPVPVLAPEKSRPRRPRFDELVDRAAELSSRIVVAVPDLDMQVDVESVIERARALAGGDLDVELATLREAAAAPIEISVEAASAELARQLGGKPIAKRERSARWETPPPVELRHPLPEPGEPVVVPRADPVPEAVPEAPPVSAARDEFSARMRAETEADPAATIAAVVSAAVEAQAPAVPVEAEPPVAPAPADTEVDDGTAEFERDDRTQTPTSESVASAFVPDVAPEAELDSDTQRPSRRLFGPADEPITEPASDSGLLIDDNADVSALSRALEGAEDAEEQDDDEVSDYTHGESTQIGGPLVAGYPDIPDQLAAQLDEQLAEAEAEADREVADGFAADVSYAEPDAQEISELDVLAEADEEDADLLAAQGYAAEPAYVEPASTHDDFASRLDLDDEESPPDDEFDHDAAREFDREAAYQFDRDAARELLANAPAPIEDDSYREPVLERRRRPSSEPSSSYTFAEDFPNAALHPHEGADPDDGEKFDEPHGYAPAPAQPRGPDPRLLKHGRATTTSEDLEDALAALDVDLDNIAGIQQRRARRATPSAPRPLPGLPMERPGAVAPHPTGPQPLAPSRVGPPTGQQPVAPRPPRPTASHAKPPPIPAAARKPPTQQVPIVHTPAKRASTEDGILIDFDDDE